MDTSHDDTDTLRKRHSGTQRLVAILLCSLLVVGGMAGVVLAQTADDFNEDFEDGDITIDSDGWSGWRGDTDGFEASTDGAINGTYSGVLKSGPSDSEHSVFATRDANTTLISFEAYMKVNRTNTGGTGDYVSLWLEDDAGNPFVGIIFSAQPNTGSGGGSIATPGLDEIIIDGYDPNQVYRIYVDNVDFEAQTFDVTVEGGGQSGSINGLGFENPASGFGQIELENVAEGGAMSGHYDNMVAHTTVNPQISGQVTDQEGDPIEGATVETNTSISTTTNETGHYLIEVNNGTVDMTASKDGYVNDTATVDVSDGQDATQDFTLIEDSSALQIDTRLFIEHGESVPYTIIHGKADGTRENVTASATVTSNNTSVVTVDTSTFELNATDDTSVNERTFITATYTRSDGETLTQTQNVTVANKTVANLDILPPVTRFAATLDDKTIQTILIATGVGVAAAVLAGAFAGIAGISLIMLMGWVIGIVGNGMIIVTLLTAMFIGMNVAGNVDYTVRR